MHNVLVISVNVCSYIAALSPLQAHFCGPETNKNVILLIVL